MVNRPPNVGVGAVHDGCHRDAEDASIIVLIGDVGDGARSGAEYAMNHALTVEAIDREAGMKALNATREGA